MAKQGSFEGVIVRVPFPEILEDIARRQDGVVEASAGTGKTFTLEHLFIDLILGAKSHFVVGNSGHSPVPPSSKSLCGLFVDQILLMTFTQKAVLELRTRCHAKLAALVQLFDEAQRKFRAFQDFKGSPEDGFCLVHHEHAPNPFEFPHGERTFWNFGRVQRASIKAALDNFEMVDISTIHAFCQKTLREEAFRNGAVFEEKVVDEDGLFSRVFRKCLRSGLVDEALLHQWNGKVVSPSQRHGFPLQDRSLELLMRSVSGRALRGEGTAFDVADALQRGVQEALQDEKVSQGLMTFDDMLLRVRDGVVLQPKIRGSLGERYGCILVDEFQDTDRTQWEILQTLKKAPHPPRIIVIGDPKQSIYRFRGADLSTYERAREELCGLNGPLRLDTNFRSSSDLLDALNGLFDPDAFAQHSPGKGFVAEVISFLDSPEEVASWQAKELRSAGHIERSLLKCRLPLKAGKKRHLVRESSDKTSGKYALVNVDDELAANRYLTHAEYGAIWVKAGRFDLRFCGSGRGENLSGAPLCIFQLPPRAANPNIIRCNLIAQEIHLLTYPGSLARIETHEGTQRAVRKSDIFVLVRNKSLAEPLTAALAQLGIPYTFQSDSVFDGQAAKDIADLLRGVMDPYSKSASSLAALTPFFGLSLSTLADLTPAQFQRQITEPLAEWKALADRGHFGELFDRLMSASNGRRIFAGDARGLSDTAHIFDLLLREIGVRSLAMSEVIEVLDGWMSGRDEAVQERDSDGSSNAKAVRILDAPSLGDGGSIGDDSVQILTMHASKGLEAPVVFVLEALHPNRPGKQVTQLPEGTSYVDDGTLDKLVASALEELKSVPPEEDVLDDAPVLFAPACQDDSSGTVAQVALSRLADAERLIYVAMTRAKVRLYVFMTPPLAPDGTVDAVACSDWGGMNRRLELAVTTGVAMSPADGFSTTPTQVASSSEDDPAQAQEKTAEVLHKLACLKAYTSAMRASKRSLLDEASRTLVKTSYSRLAHENSEQIRFLGTQALKPRLVVADEDRGAREEALSEVESEGFFREAPSGESDEITPLSGRSSEEIPGADCLPGGPEVGTFVHALFEKVPPSVVGASSSPEELVASDAFQKAAQTALSDQGLELSELQVARASELVWHACRATIPGLVGAQNSLGECPGDASLLELPEGLIHEVEFLFPIPEVGEGWVRAPDQKVTKGFVQGFIDGIFRGGDGRIWFLDWKTNRLEDGSIEGIRRCFDECYAIQAKLYTIALTRHLDIATREEFEARFGGFAYVFVRNTHEGSSDGILSLRPTFDDVASWMAELSDVDFTQRQRGQ